MRQTRGLCKYIQRCLIIVLGDLASGRRTVPAWLPAGAGSRLARPSGRQTQLEVWGAGAFQAAEGFGELPAPQPGVQGAAHPARFGDSGSNTTHPGGEPPVKFPYCKQCFGKFEFLWNSCFLKFSNFHHLHINLPNTVDEEYPFTFSQAHGAKP